MCNVFHFNPLSSSLRSLISLFAVKPTTIPASSPTAMSGSIAIASGDRPTLSLKPQRRVNGGEPLARFGEAKKVLGGIYAEVGSYVDELEHFYSELTAEKGAVANVSEEQRKGLENIAASIKIISETFHRDHMKVVFFGRTSNGKSTTINAMLHDKVLPQGMGHTTCCFLQVEGCNENEGYLKWADNDEKKLPLGELRSYGHALGDTSALPAEGGYNRTLRVFHPRTSQEGNVNRLLQHDVVIVDSPGVDVSPEFDSWIDTHCLDADVFVLVSNAESTLTNAEKQFFHRVSQRLSKPNIFVLNNRWDASAGDGKEVAEQVRKQHEQRLRNFLVNELHVCTEREVDKRIYFVSSREMLESRLRELGKQTSAPYKQEGHTERMIEFNKFEEVFEQCISRSAIQTKLEGHNRRALEIVNKLRENVDTVQLAMGDQKRELLLKLEESSTAFTECREQFARFEEAYKLQTDRLRQEVHVKVSADFTEEIQRLERVIDKFEKAFVDDAVAINDFKKELAVFVDDYLTRDLEARCTGGLMTRIWNIENSMFQCVKNLLPAEYQPKLEEVWRYRAPFKFQICVNVPQLTADFHEDLEFRFSFGLSAIVRRLVAYRTGQPVTALRGNLLTFKGEPEPSAVTATDPEKQASAEAEAAMMSQVVLTSAAYLANGGVGLVLVAGIVYKTVGWKVIAGVGAVYGGLYAYERLRWNSSAKEQHLKQQFRTHLATRMQNVAAAHTTHCETQAAREMEQVYEGLRATVGGVHRAMKDVVDEERTAIESVDKTLVGLGAIKGKTAFALSSRLTKKKASRATAVPASVGLPLACDAGMMSPQLPGGQGGLPGGGGAMPASGVNSDRAFIRNLLSSRSGGRRGSILPRGQYEVEDQPVQIALNAMFDDPNVPAYQCVLMETLVRQQSEMRNMMRTLLERDAAAAHARAASDGQERSSMEESDVLTDPGPSEEASFVDYNNSMHNGSMMHDQQQQQQQQIMYASDGCDMKAPYTCPSTSNAMPDPLPTQYTRVRRGRNSRPLNTNTMVTPGSHNISFDGEMGVSVKNEMANAKMVDSNTTEDGVPNPYAAINGNGALESLLAATYQGEEGPGMEEDGEEGMVDGMGEGIEGGEEGEEGGGGGGGRNSGAVENVDDDPALISEKALRLLNETSVNSIRKVKERKGAKKGRKPKMVKSPVVLGEKTPGGDEVKFLGGQRVGTMLQCGVCGLLVRHVTRLREHMTTHTGEKNYCCSACPMRFGRKDSMHAHFKRIHERQAAAFLSQMQDGGAPPGMSAASTAYASAIAPLNL